MYHTIIWEMSTLWMGPHMASKGQPWIPHLLMKGHWPSNFEGKQSGLTALLSNNTWSMIHSPWIPNYLDLTFQGQMSWGKLKDHIWFTIYICVSCKIWSNAPFRRWNLLKVLWPWKVIQGQMSWGKLIVHRLCLVYEIKSAENPMTLICPFNFIKGEMF